MYCGLIARDECAHKPVGVTRFQVSFASDPEQHVGAQDGAGPALFCDSAAESREVATPQPTLFFW